MKYYKVTAKCGHVGKGMFCLKHFYVKSKSKNEARKLVRTKPRVKKGLRNCIVDVHRISHDEYVAGRKDWHEDPYFRCRSPEDLLKAKTWATNKIRTNCPADLTERRLFENQKNTKDLSIIKRRIQLCLNFFVKKGIAKAFRKTSSMQLVK